MADDLTFGVALKSTSDGSVNADVKSARDEIEALNKSTEELSATSSRYNLTARQLAEGQMGMSISASNAKDAAWALANGYKDVDGALVKVAKSTEGAAHVNAGMTREMIVMGHEVVTGNFSRIPGSLMVMASRAGLTGTAMVGLGAAVAAPAAALGMLALAIYDGEKELAAMDRALALTSDYSGQTSDSLRALAVDISANSQLTIGQSKEMSVQLAASGRIGYDSFNGIAAAVAAYAQVTGESEAKVTPMMIKMFADPAKGAAELNSTMHFLTAAQLDHIATLEREGQVTQAQTALADALNEKLKGQKQQLESTSTSWRSFSKDISAVWNALKGVEQESTLDEKIKAAQEALAMSTRNADMAAAAHWGVIETTNEKTKDQIALNFLLAQQKKIQEDAATKGAAAETQKYDTETIAIARQNSELWKTYLVKEQLARVTGGGSVDAPTNDAVMQDAAAALSKKLTVTHDGNAKILADAKRFDQQGLESHKDALEKWADAWQQTEDLLVKMGAAGTAQRLVHEHTATVYMQAELDKRNAASAAADQKQAAAEAKQLATQLASENLYFAQVAAATAKTDNSAKAREDKRFADEIIAYQKNFDAFEKLDIKDKAIKLAQENKFQLALDGIIGQHEDIRASIKDESDRKMVDGQIQWQQISWDSAGAFFGSMKGLMNSHSHAMFEVGKLSAISQTVINTRTAAMGAYQAMASIPYIGPALGIAAAAAAVAAGTAEVAAIKNADFGGGSGGGASYGGATSALNGGQATTSYPSAPASAASSAQTATQQTQPVTVNIYNTGNVLSSDFVNNTIIPQIKSQIANADVLIIDPRSRQAQVLAAA